MPTPHDLADVERTRAAFFAAVRAALPGIQTTCAAFFAASERAGHIRIVSAESTPAGASPAVPVCDPGASAYAGIAYLLGALEGLVVDDPGTTPAPPSAPPSDDEQAVMRRAHRLRHGILTA